MSWAACSKQGITFTPLAADLLGAWHPVSIAMVTKLGSALVRRSSPRSNTSSKGCQVSVGLIKGNATLFNDRVHTIICIDQRLISFPDFFSCCTMYIMHILHIMHTVKLPRALLAPVNNQYQCFFGSFCLGKRRKLEILSENLNIHNPHRARWHKWGKALKEKWDASVHQPHYCHRL